MNLPYEVQNALINTDSEPTHLLKLIKYETDEDIINAVWGWEDSELISFQAWTETSLLVLIHDGPWSYLARFDRSP